MRGSQVTTSKTEKRYPLTQLAALKIFLILLIPLLIAAVHVYKLGVASITSYESLQLKTMITRSAETGTDLINMEGRKAAEEGSYLNLAEAMKKIDAIDFVSIGKEKDGGSGWIKSTVDMNQANLQFWYIVVRGDGRILLVDNTAGTSRELNEEENLFEKCREAEIDTKAVQWEENGEFFSLFLQHLDGPLTFAKSPLLYNVADANIGMLVKGNMSFVEASARGRVLRYVLILFGFLLFIIAAMCVSVHRSLRVLRDMSGIMQRYRIKQNSIIDELNKRLSVLRKRAGESELKELTESFYVMAVNLIDYQDTIDSIKNKYEPFVPEALLSIFHKDDILDIRPGDFAELTGDLLKVHFKCSGAESTNKICETLCEIIKSKGGIVLHISESKLEAIFPVSESNSAPASKAARAGEEAAELINELRKTNTSLRAITTEIRYGIFHLQVIGSEKRMAIRLTGEGNLNA